METMDTKNCYFCKFQKRNFGANSSPLDVIMACSIGEPRNIDLFVQSLRTTSCKAKCIFILDEEGFNSLDEQMYNQVIACGGQIINVGYVKEMSIPEKQNYLYIFCYEFLLANCGAINRFIIADMYDNAFQGDPFNRQMEENLLKIVDERVTFDSEPGYTNMEWLQQFDSRISPKYYKYYYCTGFIGGKAHLMLRFLHVFIEHMKFGRVYTDQGLFNYLYFSGILRQHGIELSPQRKDELIRHTAGIFLGSHARIGKVRTYDRSKYAAVVHHYYLSDSFFTSLLKACINDTDIER